MPTDVEVTMTVVIPVELTKQLHALYTTLRTVALEFIDVAAVISDAAVDDAVAVAWRLCITASVLVTETVLDGTVAVVSTVPRTTVMSVTAVLEAVREG